MLGVLCGLRSHKTHKIKRENINKKESLNLLPLSYYPKFSGKCPICNNRCPYLLGWKEEELKCLPCAKEGRTNTKKD
jgi:Zn ribbon nucleic-acid-binding protein